MASLVNSYLHTAGLKVFCDQTQVTNSEKVDNKLRKAMSHTKCALLLLTPNSADSDFVVFEVGMALYAGIPIYVLQDGFGVNGVPEFFRSYRLSGLDELPKVVAQIQSLAKEPASLTTA